LREKKKEARPKISCPKGKTEKGSRRLNDFEKKNVVKLEKSHKTFCKRQETDVDSEKEDPVM